MKETMEEHLRIVNAMNLEGTLNFILQHFKTQSEVADSLRMSRAYFSQILHGHRMPSKKYLDDIKSLADSLCK